VPRRSFPARRDYGLEGGSSGWRVASKGGAPIGAGVTPLAWKQRQHLVRSAARRDITTRLRRMLPRRRSHIAVSSVDYAAIIPGLSNNSGSGARP
jgi:hypothetical protein